MQTNYSDFFETITFKDNKELLAQVYLLRHEVFNLKSGQFGNTNCSECSNSEEIEADPYEKQSLHSLIFYKPLKKFIGSVRLILPDLTQEKVLLPIEILLQQHLGSSACDLSNTPRSQIAEVSGITVLPEFRPKLAVLELLRAVINMSLESQITHLYAALEACVRRTLIRAKLKLHPIGMTVDYHGKRQCYLENIQQLVEDIYCHNSLVWDIISSNNQLLLDFAKVKNTACCDETDEAYNYL